MGPVHEQEVWLSRFANRLREIEPKIDDDLALDLAKLVYSLTYLLKPEEAVTLLLRAQKAQHDQAVDIAASLVRDIKRTSGAAGDWGRISLDGPG